MSAVSRRFHTVDGTLRKLLQERCWQQRLQLRIIRAMVAVDDQVVAAGSEENINTYSEVTATTTTTVSMTTTLMFTTALCEYPS